MSSPRAWSSSPSTVRIWYCDAYPDGMICPAITSTVAGCSVVRAARTAWANAHAPLSEVPTTYCATTFGESASDARNACGTRPMFMRSFGSRPGIEVT